MILSKKLEKRYYTDLNDVSIWRWNKLTETNEYKYICRDGKEPDGFASGVYQHLLFQFENLNLSSLQERRDISLQVIDMIIGISESEVSIKDIDIIYTLVEALVIDPINMPIDLLQKMIKEPDLKIQLSFIKAAKKRYDTIKEGNVKINILDRVAECSKAMNGMYIDVTKVSIPQFLAYERIAYKK